MNAGIPFVSDIIICLTVCIVKIIIKRSMPGVNGMAVSSQGTVLKKVLSLPRCGEGADCAASYLYEHVPAIDHLARHSDPFISAKNVASVAAQTGRRHILTRHSVVRDMGSRRGNLG